MSREFALVRVLTVALALLLSGCTTPAAPIPAPQAPAIVGEIVFGPAESVLSCDIAPCFEPSVAVDTEGRTFVADASGRVVARLSPGLPFTPLAVRPPPGVGGDGFVQVDAQERVWVSALARTSGSAANAVWIARSDDGGLTWPLDRVVPFPGRVDRQWLVPEEGRLVVTYNDLDAGIRAAVSLDDGATFSEPTLIAPGDHVHGQGIAHDGRVLVPFFHYDGTPSLRIAALDGAGWTALPASLPSGDFFPSLAANDAGLVMAWRAGRALLVSTSPDGLAWSTAQPWSSPNEELVASPWAVPGGAPTVAWPAQRDGAIVHALARLDADGLAGGAVEAGPAPADERPAQTDFAHATRAPDGDVVVVWIESGGARVILAKGR